MRRTRASVAEVTRMEERVHELETRAHQARGMSPEKAMDVSRAYRDLAAIYEREPSLRELRASAARKAHEWQERAELERQMLKEYAESQLYGDRRRRAARAGARRGNFLPWFAPARAKRHVRAVKDEELLEEADRLYRKMRTPAGRHKALGRQSARRVLRGYLGDEFFRVWLHTRAQTVARE